MKTRWLNCIVFVVLGAALVCCSKDGKQKGDTLPQLPVRVLVPQDIVLHKGYICEINAVQYVEIHARVQGYLEEILIDEGNLVKKGQPLFRISSNEYEEMVIRAEANLQRAIAEAKTKELDVDRIELMVNKKVISPMELEVAKANRDASQSGIREAQSVLQNAKTNLNYTFIRAPFDGVVDRIPFKRGSLINSGTLLTSISNIDQVFAYFKVSETEYLQLLGKEIQNRKFIKEHQRVNLELADGTLYKEPGSIETIEGDFDPQTGSIAIRVRFDNPDYVLKHGSSGKILVDRKQNALLIPQASTFTIQDKNYVYLIDKKNTVHAVNFIVSDRYEEFFVVHEGLEKGDRIVLEGLQKLRDGVIIHPTMSLQDTVSLSHMRAL